MRRPRIVTFLVALVFLLGLLQWLRAGTLFVRRDFLAQLNLSISLPYAIGSAAIWGGVLVAASFGLWRLKRWGWWLALGAVSLAQAQQWFDRLVFDRSDYARLSRGFALGTTLLILALIWGGLGWPSIRKRFEIGD